MLSINERKTTNEQMRNNCIVRSERHRFALLPVSSGRAWVGKLQRTFTHTHIDRMAPGPHSRKIVLLLEHVPKHY